jgi:hypothetical protein
MDQPGLETYLDRSENQPYYIPPKQDSCWEPGQLIEWVRDRLDYWPSNSLSEHSNNNFQYVPDLTETKHHGRLYTVDCQINLVDFGCLQLYGTVDDIVSLKLN